MCGCDFTSSEEVEDDVGSAAKPEPARRVLPKIARAAAAAGLVLVILAAAVLGLVSSMNRRDAAEATISTLVTPTQRPAPTRTRTPTIAASPTPFVSPTPIPPRSHQVQQGETLSEIAADYEVSMDEILQYNADLDPALIQVGQVLLIPPDLSQVIDGGYGPADDPEATRADFVVHVVRSGEALLSIAEKYGVSVQAIRRANDIDAYDSTLQVNQSLIIPLSEPTPVPTATPHADAQPTVRPPYPPPPLLSPIDNENVMGTGQFVVLQWASVGILEDGEWYQVELELAGGGEFSASHVTRTTSWRVPLELLSTAGVGELVFRWQVQVVKERPGGQSGDAYAFAGSPSVVRSFTWVGPDRTPTADVP
jgi:LysM repeat protein